MAFNGLFPNLHYWAESDNQLQLGTDADNHSFVTCLDKSGTFYESPTDVIDLQKAAPQWPSN